MRAGITAVGRARVAWLCEGLYDTPAKFLVPLKNMVADQVEAWAAESAELLARYQVEVEQGLRASQVEEMRSRWGRNQLRQRNKVTRWQIFRSQLESVVVVLLLAASILSLIVGDFLESGAIAAAIVLTLATGFFTELRAIRSMEALRRLGAARARVRRDGADQMIKAQDLVPGDIVVLEGGDRVSADLRLIEGSKLQVDESALTGESVPVSKSSAALPPETALADRRNMLYKGTLTTRGSGLALVVATGMHSELGRIAALIDKAEDETTPLERQLATLAQQLVWVCMGIAVATVLVGVASGREAMLMIETGIALAVAAIPEGLPVVATIALARGMWRLAGRHALIKTLSAVETLGATGVIVADKTGTLTENRLSVASMHIAARVYAFGSAIECESQRIESDDDPGLRLATKIAALCVNASLNAHEPTGDPLEVALLRAARLAGQERAALLALYPEVREEAFDSETKMMATVHEHEQSYFVAVKGAPEEVLRACVEQWQPSGSTDLSNERRDTLLALSHQMATTGLRVLSLACKEVASAEVEVYEELSFVALVGLADPARRDVIEPIAACKRAGIRVIMATGDQPATAQNIALAVGMVDDDHVRVVNGSELGKISDLTLEERSELLGAQIFARVTPEQKLDIIELHQRAGAVVAMTGDGVNDAPALRKAEIGIAMGKRGTDVARDAANIVLRDDSFESIVAAVEQGRAIFENIRRFVIYLLSCNVSELLVVTIAVAIGAPLPLLPLQILFLNLVTDVFPALALGFGEGEAKAMSRAPRSSSEAIVSRRDWLSIAGYAGLMTAAVLGAMGMASYQGASAAQATTVSFLTLAFCQLWHVFNMRSPGSRLLDNDVARSLWVWGALLLCTVLVILAVFLPPLARVLDVATLSTSQWSIAIAASLLPMVLGQVRLGHGRAIPD